MSDSEAIINPAAVAEGDHDDDEFAVADLVDDAVVPDADAQQSAVALKGFGAAGPRLGGQGGHGVDQAALDWPVDPAQCALGCRTQDDLKRVGWAFVSRHRHPDERPAQPCSGGSPGQAQLVTHLVQGDVLADLGV